jgi:hypothetical protein
MPRELAVQSFLKVRIAGQFLKAPPEPRHFARRRGEID